MSELQEAVLIAITGCTGLTMPDRAFDDPRDGKPIMVKPNLTLAGRTAGSPDNAQGTHFFMINDTGAYCLRKLPPAPNEPFDADTLTARARASKVRVLDHRLDVAEGQRDFPAYLDSNRFLSNLQGTTLFFPAEDEDTSFRGWGEDRRAQGRGCPDRLRAFRDNFGLIAPSVVNWEENGCPRTSTPRIEERR